MTFSFDASLHNASAGPDGRYNAWLQGLPPFDPRPVTLTGKHVIIAPLAAEHAEGLYEIGREPSLWHFLPRRPALRSVEDTREWIAQAQAQGANGSSVAFAVIHAASGRVAGTSRYLDIVREDRILEIGWTFVGKPYQRTAVNTEAKLLLLTHAFETQGAIRVQLKTDLRNTQSQAAIERLGAVKEGVLRNHVITYTGYIRDTVMYGITRAAWPAVKGKLEEMINAK